LFGTDEQKAKNIGPLLTFDIFYSQYHVYVWFEWSLWMKLSSPISVGRCD